MLLKQLTNLYPAQSFLIVGGEDIALRLRSELVEKQIEVHHFNNVSFNRASAEAAREKNNTKSDGPVYIICSFETITGDAHQLLLKTIEEPGEQKYFCFITLHPDTLPATVRSRLIKIQQNNEHLFEHPITAMELEKALEYIKKEFTTETLAEEKKGEALAMLDALEFFYNKKKDFNRKKLEVIYEGKKKLLKGNLSPKQLLEYVLTSLFSL